jgi:hypothetical protein
MARSPSSNSVAAQGAWLLVAELTDLLEHPAAVHAGDLIGMGYRRSRTLVRHVVSTWYLRPMPMELPAYRTARGVDGSGVWPVLRMVRTDQVLLAAALQEPVP